MITQLHDILTDRKLRYQTLGGFGRSGSYALMPRPRTVQIQLDEIRQGIERHFCANLKPMPDATTLWSTRRR